MQTRWLMIIGLVFLTACSTTTSTPPETAQDDSVIQEKIDRYLSTTNPGEEAEVVADLKSSGVTTVKLRELIRKRPLSNTGKAGTFINQPVMSGEKKYPFALFAPPMEKGKKYPLVIILHGAGGNGKSTLTRWVKRLGDDFIIACPSYPMGAWWSFRAEAMVLNLIQHLRLNYPIDANRVLLAGMSNGAVGAYMLGMFYPDYFAGVVPIAGTISERYMHFLVNMVNTPIYSIQGEHDPIFPIKFSQRIRKIMTTMKYPAVFREHDQKISAHGGHFLPKNEIPALVTWMKNQRRKPNPKVVRLVRESNHMGPVQWARVSKGLKLAALQLPGPEKEPVNVKDGKIATLIGLKTGDNQFEIQGKNLLEHELLLNSELVDFSKPIKVTFIEIKQEGNKLVTVPKGVSFEGKVNPDINTLLQSYKKRRDPDLLHEAIVPISVEEKVQIAAVP
ncbi:MAG: hypothetical protein G3M70_01575 [Candidatus Nitronauta litoralis]|uniref:Phospholipase/carboxylesterase/thioesterase domain-containing protein n=1 Tax=Candidatus Nitronauta litoralis TaxID=2705533 RepID=A0A7T0FZ09_9BACT|nr:MAG: hypothetical protein G3M70_01575 [Candidatus Nitronauta litoralis]